MCVLWSCTGVTGWEIWLKSFISNFLWIKFWRLFAYCTLFYCCIIICFFCSYPLVQTQLICEEVNKSHFSAACKRTREEIEEIKSGCGLVNTDIESLRWVYYSFFVNLILLLFALYVHVYTWFKFCIFLHVHLLLFFLLPLLSSPPFYLSLYFSFLLPFFPPFLLLSLSPSSQRIQANEERVSALKQKILTYDTSLPPLIKAWASLKTSTVLHGDYDLKLQRQEYYLSKKDEVLKNLLDPFDRFCMSSCVCVCRSLHSWRVNAADRSWFPCCWRRSFVVTETPTGWWKRVTCNWRGGRVKPLKDK